MFVAQKLGYRKFCTRQVPKMFTEIYKSKRMSVALDFFLRYNTDEEEFINIIVTGDETWVVHVNTETKQQLMTWGIPLLQISRRKRGR